VGYSTHFNAQGVRRCDLTPPGQAISLANDQANADHELIVAEWLQPPHSQQVPNRAMMPRQFIEAHLTPPVPTPQVVFQDNFDGTTFDVDKWSNGGTGAVTVAGGEVSFGCTSFLSTRGKYTFTGSKIVVEARMVGPGNLRDTVFALYEASGPNLIQAGDTNYGGYGLYSFGSGPYGLSQTGIGNSVSVYKEYRMTLDGAVLTLERGDTLSNITERVSRTMSASIAGTPFFLLLGTGGPDYCPGKVDWITVKTQ
jgi:hypothetical protein